jgi:bacterioferritin-associated ferredoxin
VDYVCLCNGITDEAVRRAAAAGARSPQAVLDALGCRSQCGKCQREMAALLRDEARALAKAPCRAAAE